MNLTLLRYSLQPAWTGGVLLIDRQFECFIGEDRYRPDNEKKVPGETCIPVGRYEITRDESPKYGRPMPRLWNQKTSDGRKLVVSPSGQIWEGILIHSGNTAIDTKGCLLTGRVARADRVDESTLAFNVLDGKLADALQRGRVWIDVLLAT